MSKKCSPFAIAVVSISLLLSGCVDTIKLAYAPDTGKNYKFLDVPAVNAKSPLTVGDNAPGGSINATFTPSLFDSLDYRLQPLLDPDADKRAVKVSRFTIKWVNETQMRDGIVMGVGAAVAGAVGVLAANAIAAPAERHGDNMLCYFKGKYRDHLIEIQKSIPCPDGANYCFGSSAMKPLDTALPATQKSIVDLVDSCVNDIVNSIQNIKSDKYKSASF